MPTPGDVKDHSVDVATPGDVKDKAGVKDAEHADGAKDAEHADGAKDVETADGTKGVETAEDAHGGAKDTDNIQHGDQVARHRYRGAGGDLELGGQNRRRKVGRAPPGSPCDVTRPDPFVHQPTTPARSPADPVAPARMTSCAYCGSGPWL